MGRLPCLSSRVDCRLQFTGEEVHAGRLVASTPRVFNQGCFMRHYGLTLERICAFTDGVFAVIITILVIDLHAPADATWAALMQEWPTAVSYAVSYLFVAIAWLNGHHLLSHATRVTPKLIWANFAQLFSVSLLPFVTAWMSRTRLGAVPVCLYAIVFVLVNASYIALCMEAVDTAREEVVSAPTKRVMRMRAVFTLLIFASAAVLALWYPVAGFCVVTATLLTYMHPSSTPVFSRSA